MNYQITADNLTVITHNDLPVITTELLAHLYRTEVKHIQNNYLRNADRFIVGKHLFKLENYELKDFKNRPSLRGLVAKNTRSLILWTERGAARHAKMLETDQAWDVFEQLEDCYFNSEKVNNPQPRPETPELLTDNDTRNLAHLVWSMANGFRFERAWTQGIWYALRHATGVASPQHFEVNQISIIAEECQRIYGMTSTLKSAIFDAEKQVIRRLLRHKENVETVLREMQQLLEVSTHEHDSVMTQSLERWQQANVNHFLQRN